MVGFDLIRRFTQDRRASARTIRAIMERFCLFDPLIAQAVVQDPRLAFIGSVAPGLFVMPDFHAFATVVRGIQEFKRWTLYAFKAYAAAGHTELLLFDQNEGSATNGRADTNLKGPGGMMPGNEALLIIGLRIKFIPAQGDVFAAPTSGAEAYNVFTTNCWAEFKVGDKEYGVGAPLTMYPEGSGLVLFCGGGATTNEVFTTVQNGSPDNRAVYQMDPPIGLLPTMPFSFTLRWRALQTVTAAGRMGAYLDGWKFGSVG